MYLSHCQPFTLMCFSTDHILLRSTWAFVIEHHLALPGMVTPPYPSFSGFCVRSCWMAALYWPQREVGAGAGTEVRVLLSLHWSALSFPSSPAFPGGGGPPPVMLGVLQDKLGLLEMLAQDPQAPSRGPCLGCVVMRDLFPPCDVRPFSVLMAFHAGSPPAGGP